MGVAFIFSFSNKAKRHHVAVWHQTLKKDETEDCLRPWGGFNWFKTVDYRLFSSKRGWLEWNLAAAQCMESAPAGQPLLTLINKAKLLKNDVIPLSMLLEKETYVVRVAGVEIGRAQTSKYDTRIW